MATWRKDEGDQDAGAAVQDEPPGRDEPPGEAATLDLGLTLSVYGRTPEGRFVEIRDDAASSGLFTEH